MFLRTGTLARVGSIRRRGAEERAPADVGGKCGRVRDRNDEHQGNQGVALHRSDPLTTGKRRRRRGGAPHGRDVRWRVRRRLARRSGDRAGGSFTSMGGFAFSLRRHHGSPGPSRTHRCQVDSGCGVIPAGVEKGRHNVSGTIRSRSIAASVAPRAEIRLATVSRAQLPRRSSRTRAREHPSAAAQAATPTAARLPSPGVQRSGPSPTVDGTPRSRERRAARLERRPDPRHPGAPSARTLTPLG
jgi:hypothetical protein